jgi:hypothetical protein
VENGKLNVPASLHATLTAMRKCQNTAMMKEHAEKQKLNAQSQQWLQVRARVRFRVASHAWRES